MHNSEKLGKNKKAKKAPSDDQPDGQILGLLSRQAELLDQVIKKLQDHDAQFKELENNQDATGRAKLYVAERAYNPDRKHLSEMTVISLRTVEPFALATVCASVMSKEVLNNEVSLGEIYMEEVKRLLRSVKGKVLDLAAQHARETEVSKTEEYGNYDQATLGKGM